MPSPKDQQLNFILIPLMSPGHIIPMIDMARVLAGHGVAATIITTTSNAARFYAGIDRAAASGGLPIRLLQVQFPSEEAGLPKGCESVDNLPSYDLVKNFFSAIEMLQQPIEKFIEELIEPSSPCCCIICDKHIAWTAETARKFQVPWISFDGMSCFTQLCIHNLHMTKVYEGIPEGQPFILPNLPDKIKFTRNQLPGTFNPGTRTDLNNIRERVRAAEKEAYGVVVNSFEGLETRYVEEFRKLKRGKVWCIGPLSLSNKDNLDKGSDKDLCLEWLDSMEPGSVVYACLGSLGRLALLQFIELALGLEESNHPFILVVRGGKKEEIENWILEDGFEERTKGRGFLIRGWAPQVLILSHPAIGGFLTHCGWNSTLEAVSAGLPMITWPLFAEQFFNEKLVVEILDIGVSVGAKAVRHLEEQDKLGISVGRDEIHKAICRVMDEGKFGKEIRRRAKEVGEMAKRAVEKGGSSYLNIELLIQDIRQLLNNGQTNPIFQLEQAAQHQRVQTSISN
ncbi:hypothetical protein ACH5RR_004669 [Cinchona calisaya]|uniref:Glycosyltransferase n=1 Tax=Cinchona calisaya TaxID=153742 RepID=A0ABD3AYV0_9GENT